MAAADSPPTLQTRIRKVGGLIPLAFEENRGQSDPRVKFLARGLGYGLFLTSDEAVLALTNDCAAVTSLGRTDKPSCSPGAVLRLGFAGPGGVSEPSGMEPLVGNRSYFVGNNPKKWHSNVPAYARVKYSSVYPGIDLVFHGDQGQLEYDFLVSPGANPDAIVIRLEGAQRLKVDSTGDLVGTVGSEKLIEHVPVAYQEIEGVRRNVAVHYVMLDKAQVAISVASYDHNSMLVIDPTVVYSTYLGGNVDDFGTSIATDAAGNAYVAGWTISPKFPTTAGAFQTAFGAGSCVPLCRHAFVTKLNAAGAAVYSTYLGGTDNTDFGTGIAVDPSGNAYITGETGSSDFPITPGSFQTTLGGSNAVNAFVSKLNATGTALVYSTYLGGIDAVGNGIAVDASGNAYVTGSTGGGFPTTPGALQTTGRSFVSKLNAAGSALVYSTRLGGSSLLGASAIAIDASGNAYVTGSTGSDFPTTGGAFQTAFGGGMFDCFITKLNATGTALVYSTFLGGSGNDQPGGIAIDASSNAYVTGFAGSNFPTTPGAFQAAPTGFANAFVSKLNANGTALDYSTYLRGSGGHGIAVGAAGDAYVTGRTTDPNLTITADAYQRVYGGGITDAFISELDKDGKSLVYSTFLGGNEEENVENGAIALDSAGNIYITGSTRSTNFPTTPGAFQTRFGAGLGSDAFVVKIRPRPYFLTAITVLWMLLILIAIGLSFYLVKRVRR